MRIIVGFQPGGATDIAARAIVRDGFEPVGNSSQEFTQFINEEIPRWEKVVKTANIRPQ